MSKGHPLHGSPLLSTQTMHYQGHITPKYHTLALFDPPESLVNQQIPALMDDFFPSAASGKQ